MRIVIQKSPEINGDVLLLSFDGNEHQVSDYYQELDLQVPPGSPMQLVLLDYQRVFMSDDPRNFFMDSGIYTIMEVRGTELLILNENGINNTVSGMLQWSAIN